MSATCSAELGDRLGVGALTPQTGAASRRLPELDGLRAIAATSILVYHCWIFSSPPKLSWNLGPVTPFLLPLQSGVTVFFVLSGFLLYLPVARAAVHGAARPSMTRYLRRRAFRILPVYWVVLIVSAFVLRSAVVSTTGGTAAVAKQSPGLFLQDLFLVGNLHPRTYGTGILPAWSLTVEVGFYLLLPVLAILVAVLASHVATTRSRVAVALVGPIALIAIGVTTNTVAGLLVSNYGPGIGTTWPIVLRQSFVAHADLFGLGTAAAVTYVLLDRSPSIRSKLLSPVSGRAAAYIGLPVFVIGYYLLPRYVYDPLVAAFFALAMLRLIARSPSEKPKGSVLASRWIVPCGLVSYSVFLWHYPILTFLSFHGLLLRSNDAVAFAGNLALAGALTGLASFLTYRLVERPAMQLEGAVRLPRLARPSLSRAPSQP